MLPFAWVLNAQTSWGSDVCANSSPFSAGGEKVWALFTRAVSAERALNNRDCVLCCAFADDRLWSTRRMRSTHCRSDAFGSIFFFSSSSSSSPGQAGACTCSVPVMTALHAPRGTGDATRPVKSDAGCRLPSYRRTQLNSWHSRWRLRASSNSFPLQERRTSTPRSHSKSESGVTTVCSTSAPNRKICKDLIRRKSGNCSNHWHFFSFLFSLLPVF